MAGSDYSNDFFGVTLFDPSGVDAGGGIKQPDQQTPTDTSVSNPIPQVNNQIEGRSSLTTDRAQQLYDQAIASGVPKSYADSFLANNPNDFSRLQSSYGSQKFGSGEETNRLPTVDPRLISGGIFRPRSESEGGMPAGDPGTPGGYGGVPPGGFPQYPGTGGAVIPPDLMNLRNVLGNFLADAVWNQRTAPQFPGGMDIGMDPGVAAAMAWLTRGLDQSASGFNDAYNRIEGATRWSPWDESRTMNTAEALFGQTYQNPQDITTALDAIRRQGMMGIEDNNAAIREQYGALGLGSGSDVAEAVARGSSRGMADITAQQSQLLAQIQENAAQRRLAAGGNLASFIGNMAGLQSGGRLQALQMMSALPTQQLAGTTSAAGTLGQLGAANTDLATQNLQRRYNEFLRTSQPQYLNEALSYATGFPPIKPVVQGTGGGAQLGAAAIGGGSSIATALILAGVLSDRNAKEDIIDLEPEVVSEGLKKLPIKRWKYKGDKTSHIGPMAQDFSAAFGVGDGHTIHLADVIGVLLASQQAMQKAVARA